MNDERKTRPPERARFEKIYNDLSWNYCALHDEDGSLHFCHLHWSGYNDQYWWKKVATKADEQIAVCRECGRRYHLDFRTCIVTQLGGREEVPQ